MPIEFLFSKTFLGTTSLDEAIRTYSQLTKHDIKCYFYTISGQQAAKYYKNDSFHVYSKTFLKNLLEFHIIRVSRFHYGKAMKAYNNQL